jgi:hypothetical protein
LSGDACRQDYSPKVRLLPCLLRGCVHRPTKPDPYIRPNCSKLTTI